jgi:nitric oxide reductase activation protein
MNSDTVRMAASILSEALNAVPRLKSELCGFDAFGEATAAYAHRGSFGRTSKMRIFLFKGFEESVAKAKQYLGGISTDGYTPLGEAYAVAMENLARRREKRKILILVTDGHPKFEINNKAHNEYLLMERVRKNSEMLGIETAGLMVNVNASSFKPYFKQVQECKDGPEMVESILRLVEKLV